MPEELHTADGVPIVQGLAVFDYNMDVGTVDLTNMSHTGWFDVVLKGGGRSLMNAERVVTTLPGRHAVRAVDVLAEE